MKTITKPKPILGKLSDTRWYPITAIRADVGRCDDCGADERIEPWGKCENCCELDAEKADEAKHG